MNTQSKYLYFPYLPIDYKAAEEWLNTQAENGWELKAFHPRPLPLVELVPTQQSDLRYCTELTNAKELDDASYLSLCADAGWEQLIVMPDKAWRIFRSLPGRHPLPLQTDAHMELKRLVRRRLRADALALFIGVPLVALILLLPSLLLPGSVLWSDILLRFLTSWDGIVILLTAAVGLPVGTWYILSELRYWRFCRRTVASGQRFPVPPQRAARRRGWGALILSVFYLVYLFFALLNLLGGLDQYQYQRWDELRAKPLVMSQDLGLGGADEHAVYLEEHATPFFHSYAFEEVLPSLYTDVYVAAAEPLARLALTAEREQLERRSLPILMHPVDLGFDESYLSRLTDRDDGHYILLLRQGNTTVRLSGAVDWTDPDILAVLWERLQLKE